MKKGLDALTQAVVTGAIVPTNEAQRAELAYIRSGVAKCAATVPATKYTPGGWEVKNAWTVERTNASDYRDNAINGTEFSWFAVWNHPTMGLVRIPFTHILSAREYANARNAALSYTVG